MKSWSRACRRRPPRAIVAKARRMARCSASWTWTSPSALFKIPCTWEGVQAVETLEREGVKCHVTRRCTASSRPPPRRRAGANLVQTYVGRVRVWYQKHPVAAVHNHLDAGRRTLGSSSPSRSAALIEEKRAKVIAASVKTKHAVAARGCDHLAQRPRRPYVEQRAERSRTGPSWTRSSATKMCPRWGRCTRSASRRRWRSRRRRRRWRSRSR